MLHLLQKEGHLSAQYLLRRSRRQIWERKGLFSKYHDCTEPWSHTRRGPELCRWMDLDILVSVCCCRIMLALHDIPPPRNFAEYRGQWIAQTAKALTTTYLDTYEPFERQRRSGAS